MSGILSSHSLTLDPSCQQRRSGKFPRKQLIASGLTAETETWEEVRVIARALKQHGTGGPNEQARNLGTKK